MSEKIYALLLRVYPAHFRKAYGDEALQLFRDRARDEQGFLSGLRLWLDLLADLASSVPREYRHIPPTLLATAAPPCRDDAPSFHLLEGEVLRPLSLFSGGALSLVIYASILFLISHRRSYFPLSDASARQRPSYALSPSPAPPPYESSRNSGDDQAASGESNSSRSDQGGATAAKKQFKEFDVASIRESKTSNPASMNVSRGPSDIYVRNGGYFHVRNLSLFGYIAFAYKLNGYQKAVLQRQLPDWVKLTKYDIEAQVQGDPNEQDMRTMMRALLANRFKLKMHSDTQQNAVLDMVLAKPGKTGPALKAHPSGDALCSQGAPNGLVSHCGSIAMTPTNETGRIKMAGRNIPLTLFADSIPGMAGKPVIDETGLTGNYDFTLDFVPGSSRGSHLKPDESGSTFQEVITARMGLKLVPYKGPVEIYVLDHVERPSEGR